MWKPLVVTVRLPLLVLGLAVLLLIAAPLMAGYTVLRMSVVILGLPLVVLGAIFSNKPDLISKHMPENIEDILKGWRDLRDGLNALVKWGTADER